MIRIGIIGCGKIADQHAEHIRWIPEALITAACDREELMAAQLCDRFAIPARFSRVEDLLAYGKVDAVHITTPPQSHYKLGKQCLESGCHVFIEKPFTVNAHEAEMLVDLAVSRGLKITTGHNAQFTSAALRMRELISAGYLGGPPVHLESYYCYNLADPSYAKALLGDCNHWVRALPGKLLHNIISHGISKIAEFLDTDNPQVIAHGFPSQVLRGINETDIIDELRVIISDNARMTGYFTFSSQMSPTLHLLRIYGPKNALIINDDHQTVTKLPGNKYKSYLDLFAPPAFMAGQDLANAGRNIHRFLKRQLHNDAGMRHLIRAFCRCILEDGPAPIPYREIVLTAAIMDAIFHQLAPAGEH